MALAFVCITTEPASMIEVLKKVKMVEGVQEAQLVYGVYDIVAKVEGETMEELKHTITHKIRRIDNVRTTVTMMVVK